MILRRPNVIVFLILLCNLLAVVQQLSVNAAPAIRPAGIIPDPEETAGMDEGDMILTQRQRFLLQNPIAPRNGLISATSRWPDRVVYYKIIGQEFEPIHRNAILEGMRKIEENTCIRFKQAGATQKDYVAISSKPGGCYTAVGYRKGAQEMNLQPYPMKEGCFRTGTILHEIMHSLGFYHEQSSAVRDDYIDVIYKNIVPGKEFNFKQYEPNVVTDFGVGYDYESCLHYRSNAFSIDGGPTIVPKDHNAIIGQREGMSQKDIDKINVMYKCPIPL